MKNKVIVAICLIVLVGLCVLSVREYRKYDINQRILNKAIQIDNQNKEAKRAAAEASAKQKLQTECASLKATYNALPQAQKVKTPVPNCDLAQIQ